MKFGAYIKARRAALGWTQPEAAARAGIEQSYLSKLENGKSTPSSEVYARLVEAYGIDTAGLADAVDMSELQKLREIDAVRAFLLQREGGSRSHTRRWLFACLAAFVLGGACFGLAQLGQTERTEFVYQSSGVVRAGESLDVYAGIDPALDPGSPGYADALARRDALLERLDETFSNRAEYRGPAFVEAVPGGQRVWRLVGSQSAPQAVWSRWLTVPAFMFFFGGLACFAIAWRRV